MYGYFSHINDSSDSFLHCQHASLTCGEMWLPLFPLITAPSSPSCVVGFCLTSKKKIVEHTSKPLCSRYNFGGFEWWDLRMTYGVQIIIGTNLLVVTRCTAQTPPSRDARYGGGRTKYERYLDQREQMGRIPATLRRRFRRYRNRCLHSSSRPDQDPNAESTRTVGFC